MADGALVAIVQQRCAKVAIGIGSIFVEIHVGGCAAFDDDGDDRPFGCPVDEAAFAVFAPDRGCWLSGGDAEIG